jgi:hypothetical protein
MKTLKYLLFVVTLASAVVGCRKPVEVSFANAEQEMAAEGGSVEVALKSNGEWTIEPTVEWLTVSPMSGTGDATLTFTAQANMTGENRSTKITASTKDNAAVITVTQEAVLYYVNVSPLGIYCDEEGGEFTVEVSSNIEWEVITPEWVSSSMMSGSNDATLTLTVSPIEGDVAASREAEVFIGSLNSASARVIVVQEVTPVMTIDLTPKNLDFVCSGETKSVTVVTDDSWTAAVEVDWVVLSQTEGEGQTEINVTIGENPEYAQRQTTVLFTTAGGMMAILGIRQDATPDPHFLEVMPLSLQFGKDGGEQDFTIGCDTDWIVDVSDEWLTVSSPAGSGNATVTLTAAPNMLLEPRTAYVMVKSGDLAAEVVVSQEAGEAPLFVDFEPDTLYAPSSGGLKHLELTSNTTWQLVASEWITILNSSGQGDASFDIIVDINGNGERIGFVNAMHNGQLLGTVTVVQEGYVSVLEASPTEIEARPEGGEYVIQVTANQSWVVTTNADWLHCTPDSGYNNGEFTITVDAMSTIQPRTSRVKVTGSTGAEVIITVDQHQ